MVSTASASSACGSDASAERLRSGLDGPTHDHEACTRTAVGLHRRGIRWILHALRATLSANRRAVPCPFRRPRCCARKPGTAFELVNAARVLLNGAAVDAVTIDMPISTGRRRASCRSGRGAVHVSWNDETVPSPVPLWALVTNSWCGRSAGTRSRMDRGPAPGYGEPEAAISRPLRVAAGVDCQHEPAGTSRVIPEPPRSVASRPAGRRVGHCAAGRNQWRRRVA